MFDWDDQELTNIIWGEDTEGKDHIVPYPEIIENKDLPDYGDNGKRTLNEEDTNSKAVEKSSASKLFSAGGKRGENHGVSDSGIIMDPQHDLPSLASSKINDNVIAKKTELDIGSEVSGNQYEDKELGELVGNSWANIGSFDDLDRIFSNDELDGHTSLGNADALWSSSKELIDGASNSSSAALGSTSWEFGDLGNSSLIEPNSENLHYEYPSAARSCEKTGITSSYRRISGKLEEQQKYNAGISSLIDEKKVLYNQTTFSLSGKTAINSHNAAENATPPDNFLDKDEWSKNQRIHGQILDKVSDSRLSGNVYDRWPSSTANIPQYDPGCASATVQPFLAPVHRQQRLPKESKPVADHHFTNAYVAPYSHGNFPQQCSATEMLRQADNEHQCILAASEARQGDVTTAGPLKMTPQEKIEKLRRRQQMRAMLAIQKQQKQLGHQASSVDYPLSQKRYQEETMQTGKSDLEADDSLTTLPCYDPVSPTKMDDPSTISDVDEYSAEDTVLYQLQDITARLDENVRQCIKDSLYRLAQSVTQRHFASNTNTAKRSSTCDLDVAKEEMSSDDRKAGNENVETETNHIDRAVAHLLFHRPLKLSVRHAETPESSTSNRLSTEQETAVSSLTSGFLAKGPDNDLPLSLSGSKPPRPTVDTCQDDVLTGMPETEIKMNSQMEHKDGGGRGAC